MSEGGVTLIAESLINGQKMVVRFNGPDWTAQPAGVEGILCAWRSSDKILWFATTNLLFQQAPEQVGFAEYQEISAHQFFDMAMEPDGTFWLAMSGGLFHYAPPLWRSPHPIQQINAPIRCLAEDAAGRLWFVAGGKLHSLQDETITSLRCRSQGRTTRSPSARCFHSRTERCCWTQVTAHFNSGPTRARSVLFWCRMMSARCDHWVC